jgi:hypothetical protein
LKHLALGVMRIFCPIRALACAKIVLRTKLQKGEQYAYRRTNLWRCCGQKKVIFLDGVPRSETKFLNTSCDEIACISRARATRFEFDRYGIDRRSARMGGPGSLAMVLALPCTRRSLGTDPQVQTTFLSTAICLSAYPSIHRFPFDRSKRRRWKSKRRLPLPKN